MREIKVLHKILKKSVPQMHKMRCHVLLDAIESLLSGCFLTVTDLGRKLHRTAHAKHNIKCMDRLLSNKHLQNERHSIYKTLCHTLCANLPKPVILVDWSDIVEQDRLMLIRAALVIDGRAIPLYESIYPLKNTTNPEHIRSF